MADILEAVIFEGQLEPYKACEKKGQTGEEDVLEFLSDTYREVFEEELNDEE